MILARLRSSAVRAQALSVPALAASAVWAREGDLRGIVREERGAERGEKGFDRACELAREVEIVRDEEKPDEDTVEPLKELERSKATRA